MIGETISHYTILEKLGEGGMGEVYLAEDGRLKRKVALKVLPAEMASDPERLARFKREAETVAAINHPNIVTIHSVEEADGMHFLTMEWVEGESLSEVIGRGPMKLDKIFELAIPLADAIAAAHAKNITHRDLKPANVMINREGRLKVLDFGLAKPHFDNLGDSDREAPTQALTTEGLAIGTVPYMSPEQVRGEPVDQRTDIFSLGVVLHEMVAGERPFQGKSGADLVSSILRDRPSSVTDLQANLPHQLGRVIQRCMEKEPDKRFQTALDVRNELEVLKSEVESGVAPLSGTAFPAAEPEPEKPKWLMPAIAGVAIIAFAGLLWFLLGRDAAEDLATADSASTRAPDAVPTTAASSDREMVVILPFDNLGQAEDKYFAAGVSDEINGRLASVSGLGVISRKTAAQYADTEKSVQQIGEELGVDYILEGTVRWAHQEDGPSRVRIAPELIRVVDDSQVWTEIYDREIDDIFEVQSNIAEEVIAALDITLRGDEEAALGEQPTDNIEAYQAYLKGIDLQQNGKTIEESTSGAEAMFEKAVELDPEFVKAWATLAQHHASIYRNGIDQTDERLAKAKAALEGAERVGTNLPETRWARGYYHYYGFQEYDRALAEFVAAAEMVPNDAESRQAIGYIFRRKGDLDSAIENLELAAELDPQDANIVHNLGVTYRARRQFDKALELADRSLALRPETDAYYFAKANYVMDGTGDLVQARRVLDQAPGNDQIGGAFNWIDYHFRKRDYDGLIARMEAIESPIPYVQAAQQMVIAFSKGLRDGADAARPELEAARALVEPILQAAPGNAQMHGWMAGLLAFLGEEEAAIRESELTIELTEKDRFSGLQAVEGLAQTYAWIGRPDEAFEVLERLFESDYEGSITVPDLELDPAWDLLRDDPRYQELVEKYQ